MTVALSTRAMLLSQLVTIYLAAAAPTGVLFFLRRPADAAPARAAARAAAAGLLFPFTLAAYALARCELIGAPAPTDSHVSRDERIESARKALVASLHGFEDRAREAGGHRADAAVRAAHDLTSTVERYTGLTLALAGAEPGGEPDERETELARVAGRGGDDLEIAGRCVRRRNASRLREHQARARLELLHALAELPDTLEGIDPSHAVRQTRAADSRLRDSAATRQPPAALLRVYERAFELLLLLEDARGVQTLVRLTDATRARLYRHREEVVAHAAREDANGEQSCTPPRRQTTPAPLSPQPLPTPISTRA